MIASPTALETTMATVTLTKDNFETTIGENDIVLLDFWAEWCGPCRMFGPVFEEASQTNTDIVFAKIDTEDQQELAGAMGIMSIPTLMIFREGIGVFSQAGALPAAALENLIAQVRALDMNEVRTAVASQ
jgi:thioredoxin